MQRKMASVFVIAFMLLTSTLAFAQESDDIQKHGSCKYCGMDRQKFANSRMLIQYDDGTEVATCSVHCAALDLALNIDKTPTALMVADFYTNQLINAEAAVWVIGGNLPGVMTRTAKWAFADKPSVEKFVKEHGGNIASFDDVMKASYQDMYSDTKTIRDKRKKMKMKTQ
jgi:copper chaperone NosL